MEKKAKRPYPGTYAEFLAAAEIMWNKCDLLIVDFYACSTCFTPVLVAENLAMIEQAHLQQSFELLKSNVAGTRLAVLGNSKKLLACCRRLKS